MTRAARGSKATAKKARTLSVDFSDAGESFFKPPEDDYNVEITKVEETESSGGNAQLTVDFKVIDGKHEGKSFRQWFSLQEQALWKLAGILRSAQVDIPAEVVELDFDDIEGRTLSVTIEHREYNGETKCDISDSGTIEEEDESAKPEPKARGKKAEPEKEKSGKGKGKKEPELPKLTTDEVQDMGEEELEEVIEKYSIEVDLADFKTLRKKGAAVLDALEEAGHIED